ncbi:MAG TPA: SRPBCC domain-containing protein [Gammaproteobacteria bacterium]|nr:SRPBCC domain-containing protein [Gammaproteobacteria bacterium]
MPRHAAPASFERLIAVKASPRHVWRFLTDVELMKAWMGEPEMALEIETTWAVGSRIAISGFHHAAFQNSGTVVAFEPDERLAYTHLSSLSRLPDRPENHTTLEFLLTPGDDGTSLAFGASGFPTVSIFKHLEFYWRGTLEILRQHLER